MRMTERANRPSRTGLEGLNANPNKQLEMQSKDHAFKAPVMEVNLLNAVGGFVRFFRHLVGGPLGGYPPQGA